MKIAVCFSGHVRSWQLCIQLWEANLLHTYPNVDVFLHLWDTGGGKYKKATLPKYHSGIVDEEKDGPIPYNVLVDRIKPVKIEVESYSDFHTDFVRMSEKWYDGMDSIRELYPNIGINRPIANISMWNKIEKCNELKSAYESEMGFRYDCVIRSRLDFSLINRLPIETYLDDGPIVTPPWPSGGRERRIDYEKGINDWWTFGPTDKMDIFTGVFSNFDLIWEQALQEDEGAEWVVNPHRLPVLWMNMNGMYLNTSGGYVKWRESCGRVNR